MRGAWAAHCFDVVRCLKPLPANTWNDATEIVVSVARVYRLDFVRSVPESLRKLHAENPDGEYRVREYMIAMGY